jgi:hypothetical protein
MARIIGPRRVVIPALLVLLGSLGWASLASGQPAQPSSATDPANTAQPQCSTALLRGTYGGEFSGVAFDADGAPLREYVGNGMGTFDGTGSMVNRFSGAANGQPFEGTSTASYTVNADCTGSMTGTVTSSSSGEVASQIDMLIVDGGRQLFLVRKEGGRNERAHWIRL